MRKKLKWMVAGLAVGTLSASAAIVLDFSVASTNTGAARLNAGASLLFDFSVDVSGNVTLDATTGSGDATVLATVNGWDGLVGTVSEASLFGTSFQLTATSSAVSGSPSISLDGATGGSLGIYGQNASRIDGVTLPTPNQESLTWALTGGSVRMNVTSFGYGAAANNISDMQVISGVSTSFYNMAGTSGTLGLDGFTISGSQSLVFTEPSDGSHGSGLGGMTFEVIPEPATLGLIAVFGGGLMFMRRRFTM